MRTILTSGVLLKGRSEIGRVLFENSEKNRHQSIVHFLSHKLVIPLPPFINPCKIALSRAHFNTTPHTFGFRSISKLSSSCGCKCRAELGLDDDVSFTSHCFLLASLSPSTGAFSSRSSPEMAHGVASSSSLRSRKPSSPGSSAGLHVSDDRRSFTGLASRDDLDF